MIPMLPLLCYLIAMYLEKQRNKEIPFWQGILPFMVTIIMITRMERFSSYRCRSNAFLWAAFFIKNHKEKILILVPIGFLLLYGIAMGKESNQMVEKDAYLQLTDKDYSYTVDEILGKEEGLYRMEQAGTRKTDTANLNRIWSVEQYSSSIYSSTYNEAYQNFRKDIFPSRTAL